MNINNIEQIDFTINEKNLKPVCSKEEFEKLLKDNINFPYSVVNKEFSKYPWNVKEELNSAAVTGMVYAATKYDPSRSDECKFISYAVHWIRYYIKEEIRKLYPVKFNQNFVTKRNKVINCIKSYKKEHNNIEPTTEYIANEVEMSEKVVKNILKVNGGENFTFLSFNMPVENEKGEAESESLNNDKLVKEYLDNAITSDGFAKVELNDLLDNIKIKMSEKDYKIFYDYYINGENLSELAIKYNLKFPSSVAYIIKKGEKICKEFLKDE